jgi:hypothetical protein
MEGEDSGNGGFTGLPGDAKTGEEVHGKRRVEPRAKSIYL